jgi:CRP-like cAMP-binding protein
MLTNTRNHFLSQLSDNDREVLQPHLKPVDLEHAKVLHRAGEVMERIYFPEYGVVSFIVGMSDGRYVEAGMFGRNSLVNAGAALHGRRAINHAVVQAKGSALVAPVAVVQHLARESEAVRRWLSAHEQMMTAHCQQVAACNALHELEARLCRWLLQVSDLLASDTLPLTQEYISQMLGVTRSTVTLAAKRLQEAGLISYSRGRVRIVDREHMLEACCECYGAINMHIHGLSGWSPPSHNVISDDDGAGTGSAAISG